MVVTDNRSSRKIYHDTLSIGFFSGYITDKGCGNKDAQLRSTGTISHDSICTSPTTSPEIS